MRRNNFGWWFYSSFRCTKRQKRWEPHEKSLQKVKYIVDSLDLTDIWRFLNADTKRFTWRWRNPEIPCRLDVFLISASLDCKTVRIFAYSSKREQTTSRADIVPGFKVKHSLITLHLTNNINTRGPGFWKLNTSLLSDGEYIILIKKTIKEEANEYKNNNEVDATLLRDTMKMKIRSTRKKGTLKWNPRKLV